MSHGVVDDGGIDLEWCTTRQHFRTNPFVVQNIGIFKGKEVFGLISEKIHL